MTIKLLGAICVILGCGGFGFSIAINAQKEITALRQLISALEFMECELSYRMTPLPQLCRLTAAISNGCIRRIFLYFADELEQHIEPSAEKCICAALSHCPDVPKLTGQRIKEMGRSLGTFDLSGQLKCIKAVNSENAYLLETLNRDHNTRTRSYKTLGLCAGAALVILFI